MRQYWSDAGIENYVKEFWETYGNIGTCLFLSRSFHQEEHISQVICPMPCFDLRTIQPIQNTDYQQLAGTRSYTYDKTKHELEML
ncbi:unnamed protein product, partial [Adineta steineri]